jgi:hypothetical protein
MNNELTDSSRIPLFILVLCPYGLRRWKSTALGKGEDLEQVAIKGDEILCNQGISGKKVLIEREPQQGADLIVAVVRQTTAICHEHQKQVEQQLLMGEALKESISQEAMLDKGKGSGDLPDPLGTKRGFLNHGEPPFVFHPKGKAERKSIESFFARNG